MDILYLSVSRIHRNMANLIQTLHTVAAFQKHGIRVTLLLPPKKRKIDTKDRLAEIGIEEELDIRFTEFLHSRWKIWKHKPLFWFYKDLLQKTKYVYVRSPRLSTILAQNDISHCLEVHNTEELIRKKFLKHIIFFHKTGLIKHLFPISKSSAKVLINYGADPKRITIAPSGVNLSMFKNISPFVPYRLKMPRISYIGRISIDRGLKIMETIANLELGEVHLIGEAEDPIPQNSFIKYHGHVPHKDIPKWYEQSDIILMPYQLNLDHIKSISPLKLFEAMASGRPIIAPDIEPIREILINEQNALLADPLDNESWIEAVKRLKHDPSLAVAISTRAKEDVKKFSWEERAKVILKSIGLKQKRSKI